MRSLLLASAAALAIAGEASAQIELLAPPPDRRPQRGAPEAREPSATLFIAPSGEPLRGAPGAAYPVVTWFARADADHDDRLTSREFIDDALTFFKQLDVNGDGVVDGFEGAAYERTIVPELGVQRDDLGLRVAPRRDGGGLFRMGRRPRDEPAEGAAVYGLLNEPQPVNGSDGDLDRRISLVEATTAAARRFRRLDSDNDGALRLDSLPATPAQTEAAAAAQARR